MTREEAKQHYTYYYSGSEGVGYWKFGGHTLSDDEFNEMYPLIISIQQKENYDKTKNWLSNRQSY